MSSTATAATARKITTRVRQAAGGAFRAETTSQGPYTFRVVLRATNPDSLTASLDQAARDSALILREVMALEVSWGIVRNARGVTLVLTVVDPAARAAAVAEQEGARAAALEEARAEVAAAAVREAPAAAEEVGARPRPITPNTLAAVAGETRCPDCTAPVTAHLPWCKGTTADREERDAAEARRAEGWKAEKADGPFWMRPAVAEPVPSPATLSTEDSEAALAHGFSYQPEFGGTRTIIVRDGSWGPILGRVTLLLAGGRPEFAAYREDGTRVGHGADRLEAAQLLRADRDARLTPAAVTLTNPELWGALSREDARDEQAYADRHGC